MGIRPPTNKSATHCRGRHGSFTLYVILYASAAVKPITPLQWFRTMQRIAGKMLDQPVGLSEQAGRL